MRDALATLGFGLLAWGLWLAWPPLSPIVAGTLLIVGAVYGHLRARPPQPPRRTEGD